MEIKIKIKPTKIVTVEKPTTRLSRNHVITVCTYGCALAPLFGEMKYLRVFSMEKHNTKRIRTKKGWKVTKAACWVTYYYDIPVELLKLTGKRVEQGTRTWKFAV